MNSHSKTLLSDTFQQAHQALVAGHIIAHPTETLFGLAVDPFNPEAIMRLLRLKGRLASQGFILLIPDRTSLDGLIMPPAPLARRLMDLFWPGPLTLLLPARPEVPQAVTGGRVFVAVRHSSSPLVAGLLAVWQRPLVSTSANLSGQPTACSAAAVHKQWGSRVAVIIAGQTPANAKPSTLLRVEGEHLSLLREGAISGACLRKLVPDAPVV